MNKANYIVFHPDKSRESTNVSAIAMIDEQVNKKWNGNIYVDTIGNGNEDPFVFNDPWLYSYCHASQLRRNFRKDSFLQTGSKIIFASGQKANKGLLCIDTFFLIGNIQQWINKPFLQLPNKYQEYFNDNQSELWMRHFRFPFMGIHDKVSHTYEAELWDKNKSIFSFLPLDTNGERVTVSFDSLNKTLLNKILSKVKGKYPVLLTDDEINNILTLIESKTKTKVLKIKTLLTPSLKYEPNIRHKCI